MFLKAYVDSKCSSLDTTFQRRDILVITKPWSSYSEIFSNHKCENLSKNMSQKCDICSRLKIPRHCLYELLYPLRIPEKPWSSMSMDFIVDLLLSNNFDSIFVIVDRFIKMTHFIPCNKTITSKETARLFINNIYKYHGLPDDIISNCGMQFVSKFWQSLFKILQVEIKLSLTYHLQTHGHTQQINQVLK